MTFLYVLSKAVYYPGSFVKAFWEHVFCLLFHVDIYAADRYVSKNALSGHVSMCPAKTPSKSFWVCFLPMVLNLLIAVPAFCSGLLPLAYLGVDAIDPLSGTFCPMFPLYCVLYLFGASFLCNLFPYIEDARHLWAMFYGKDSTASLPAKIFAFLPVCLLVCGAFLEKYTVTFWLSLGVLAATIVC